MMTSVERLLLEARTLPTTDQMILASLLIQQAQQPVLVVDEERLAAFRRVRGSLAGLLPTTKEFMAEKRAELDREERRFNERFGHQVDGVQ